MKIQSYQLNTVAQAANTNLDWLNKSYSTPPEQGYQPHTWVQLLELPSTYSYDEALLLCQLSENEWVTWIPNHGEAVLNISQFGFIGRW